MKTITRNFKVLTCAVLFALSAGTTLYAKPAIDVWYGLNQSFGQIGIPQNYINIFGNVSSDTTMQSLKYSLNGGPQKDLTIGFDTRRLAKTGDFNIDIHIDDLREGSNQVVITATDSSSSQDVKQVNVTWDSSNIWPLPFTADWSKASKISQLAQIVDGSWYLQDSDVLTVVRGYDRLIAIGDIAWTDYEVLVPFEIYGMSYSGGVGVLLRWNGHTDKPLSGWQPKTGWFPLGAVAWFRRDLLEIVGNHNAILGQEIRPLIYGQRYMMRSRVETIDGQGDLYSMKVWPANQSEPSEWDLVGQAQMAEPANGSMMLIAHYADVSFGKVIITPIGMKNITTDVTDTTATISWSTELASDTLVEYGTTENYTDSVYEPQRVTNHNVTLTGLSTNTEYHFLVTTVDAAGTVSSSSDHIFSTTGPENSGIVSDDFNVNTLDPAWTFHDPVGDCSYDLRGADTRDAWLRLSVPAGTGHDVWRSGNDSARVMQDIGNVDFEVEVKFESYMSKTFQLQGIIVEQDENNYLRFDFYNNAGKIRNFVASFKNSSPSIKRNDIVPNVNPYANPIYMKVKRQGDQWTQWYSHNGQTWTESISFRHPLAVTSVGPFAGNALGSSSPDFDCNIDYFFNNASPIQPEDNWIQPPDDCTAYIDLNAQAGDNNHQNVTAIIPMPQQPAAPPTPIHPYVNWPLKDFETGITLDVTMNVMTSITDQIDIGNESDSSTDAASIFSGIVDPTGGYTLTAPGDYLLVTFDNLDPTKTYEVAMTYNADNEAYADRVTMIAIFDADTYTQASSAGTIANTDNSFSFSMGANTQTGYVARWTDIVVSTGSFSIVAEHDNNFSGPIGYAMTSIMFKQSAPEIDTTPPVISSIQTAPDKTTAQITFATDEPATSSIACGQTSSYGGSSATNSQLLTNHTLTLNNLEPSTTYHFQITCTDESTNKATSSDLTFTTDSVNATISHGFGSYQPGDHPAGWFDTGAGNSLSQNDSLFKILNENGQNTFGTTSSLTNIHSHYVADLSSDWTDYRYTGKVMIANSTAGVGLTFFSKYPNSDKYYRLRSYNSGVFHLSPHGTNITSGTTNTGVKPILNTWMSFIIEVEDTGTRTEIKIKVWPSTANEPANWQINCYDANASRLKKGTVGLWSMSSGTRHFDDLQVESITSEPDTTPPTISTIQSAPGDTIATITWTTNEPADSSVSYGPTTAYENGTIFDAALTTNHSITLTGLTAATLYHYKIASADASTNTAESTDRTFTTTAPDTTPPIISAIVANPSSFSAQVTFTTNEPAYSSVAYGPNPSYGDSTNVSATMQTSHSFTISGLTPATQYHFQITCTDASTNQSDSNDKTFTTTIFTSLFDEDFNTYQPGNDPAGWFDTASGNSLSQNDALFKIFNTTGATAFGTTSSLTNIHTHYIADQSEDWANYRFTGKLMITNAGSGVGITFLSSFPAADKYYRLRKYSAGSFHISPHGTSITSGTTSTAVKPLANTWYEFLIEVEDTGTRTNIKAKVWPASTAEPANWQIDCYDANASRLTKGTIGFWGMSSGAKYFDDLNVE
jgi:chitodextrinase